MVILALGVGVIIGFVIGRASCHDETPAQAEKLVMSFGPVTESEKES